MRISIIGGGYVGLVSSVCFAQLGHSVNLIEIDKNKCEMINAGKPPIYEKGLERLLSIYAGESLCAQNNYDDIKKSDLTFICVGSPQNSDGHPNLSMIFSACKFIGKSLREKNNNVDDKTYHVVVVKSTVPPGTTELQIIPSIIRYSGRESNEIGFAVNPEFLREGRAIQDFMNPDRIVIGSLEERSGDLVKAVYKGIKAPIIRTSIASAEMIKYASNAFLATKISFSNEIGNICKCMGIDVYEVMHGVGMDHRIGPHFLNAGAGFGGSCFPKDIVALIRLAEEQNVDPMLLRSVVGVNDRQPLRIVELLERRIGDPRGKNIAVLGLAFKDGTDDVRESRSIYVIEELLRRGAVVRAYDPVAISSMQKVFPDLKYFENASLALKDADCCLVMTEWPEFSELDKEFDLMRSKIIIEGRKILSCKSKEGICW